MSTVKSNKFSPQSLPIVQIDGFNDVEQFVVAPSQTSFSSTNFDIKTPVRAFTEGANPEDWDEITVLFTSNTDFEIAEGVTDGQTFYVYYQNGYYQGSEDVDDADVINTSTNSVLSAFTTLKDFFDQIGESALLESFKDYGIGSSTLQTVTLASSVNVNTGIYLLVDTNFAGILLHFKNGTDVKQLYSPFNESKLFERNNSSGTISTFTEIGGSGGSSSSVDIVSEASGFTIDSSYIGKHVRINVSATASVVIPNDTAYDAPIGSTMTVAQAGTAKVRVLLDNGVTLNSADGLTATRTQFSAMTLIKVAANEWDLIGDLGTI